MKLIAITGQFRSGTSMLAEVVHYLGFPVTVSMLAPGYPTWRSEWEDPALAMEMSYSGCPDFYEHLKMRAQAAYRQAEYHGRKLPGIAIKSPFLALYDEEFEQAARTMNFQVSWEVIGREQEAIDASAERALRGQDLKNAKEMNLLLKRDLIPSWRYEDFVEDPYASVSALAAKLGVTDMDSILRAVGRVQTKEVV